LKGTNLTVSHSAEHPNENVFSCYFNCEFVSNEFEDCYSSGPPAAKQQSP